MGKVYTIFTYIIELIDSIIFNKKISNLETGRVGFIRTDGIGDFIIWSDCIDAYRELYQGKKLTLFCDHNIYELAKQMDKFDEVVPIRIRTFYNIRFIEYKQNKKTLKKYPCDLLINTMSMRGIAKNSVAAFIPAHKKITLEGWNLKRLVKFQEKYIYNGSEIEKNADFTRKLGANEFKSGYSQFFDPTSNINIEMPYFAVQVDASSADKCIQTDKLIQLVVYVIKKTGLKCCLLGTSKDIELGELKDNDCVVNLIGKTSLTDVIHIIHQSLFFIGGDTCGVHSALLSHIPSLVTYGGYHYNKFLPYHSDNDELNLLLWSVVHKMDCYNCNNNFTEECKNSIKENGCYSCLNAIGLDQMIETADNMLNNITWRTSNEN